MVLLGVVVALVPSQAPPENGASTCRALLAMSRRLDDELMFLSAADVLRYGSSFVFDLSALAGSSSAIEQLPAAEQRLVLLSIDPLLWRMNGLHGYFLMDHANFAPEIARAMRQAGLLHHADVFDRATALFGHPYLRSAAERQAFYGVFANAEATPTALDTTLLSLSDEFGSLDAYDRAVNAAVARDSDMQARLVVWRARLTDYARLDHLIERLEQRADDTGHLAEAGLGSFARTYRLIYLASRPKAQILNEIYDFFQGPEGYLAPDVAAALEDIGATKTAALVHRAIGLFPKPYPREMEARLALLYGPDAENGIYQEMELSRDLLALDAEFPTGEATEAMVLLAKSNGLLPR